VLFGDLLRFILNVLDFLSHSLLGSANEGGLIDYSGCAGSTMLHDLWRGPAIKEKLETIS
jgi:hypothetical protein